MSASLLEAEAGDAASPVARPAALPTDRWLPSFVVGLAAALTYLILAEGVTVIGYTRGEVAALATGHVWREGGWLSQLGLTAVSFVPQTGIRQMLLALASAGFAGAAIGLLFSRLRHLGWGVVAALGLVALFGGDALVVYGVTAAGRTLPLFFALAILVPAIRQIELVGDVQATIGLGVALPLLLLAGPATVPLILPIAIAAALADADGRRDGRAFTALLIVTVLPTIIVALAVIGFAAEARLDFNELVLPYAAAFAVHGLGDWNEHLRALVHFAPVLLLPVAWLTTAASRPSRDIAAATTALLVPIYFCIGGAMFAWNMPPWTAPAAALAMVGAWTAVTPLGRGMRLAALALMLASTATSWVPSPLWSDPAWLGALQQVLRRLF